jgi:hypothetical protein
MASAHVVQRTTESPLSDHRRDLARAARLKIWSASERASGPGKRCADHRAGLRPMPSAPIHLVTARAERIELSDGAGVVTADVALFRHQDRM